MAQTTEQALLQQQQDAARRRALAANRDTRPLDRLSLNDKPSGGALATRPTTNIPAVPDTRTPQQKYLDEIAPSSFVGALVKFSKDGKFVIFESGEDISADKDFIALCDETLVGYDGFVMPERETLGDLDSRDWPAGLDGQPADPWQHQICLVLQDREALEMYTFSTSSISGRRAVGNLLRHYERLRKSDPDTYPIVRLKAGGFNHRDPRVGWVNTPTFAVVGRAPKASAAKPDSSPSSDMDDEIPWENFKQ
jgi:hypothetical protein